MVHAIMLGRSRELYVEQDLERETCLIVCWAQICSTEMRGDRASIGGVDKHGMMRWVCTITK